MSISEYSNPLAFPWDELDEEENGSRWVEDSDSSLGVPLILFKDESKPLVI